MKNTAPSLRPLTLTELAALYGVCNRTFKKWLKPFEKSIGQRRGHFYTVIQVGLIFEKLGLPKEIGID